MTVNANRINTIINKGNGDEIESIEVQGQKIWDKNEKKQKNESGREEGRERFFLLRGMECFS